MTRPTGATVYLLKSQSRPDQPYIGVTRTRLRDRIRKHNAGGVPSTRRYRPWQLQAAFWFRSERIARRFERHLKTGSGRAFAKRHF